MLGFKVYTWQRVMSVPLMWDSLGDQRGLLNSKYPLCKCGCPQGQRGKLWGGVRDWCDGVYSGEMWPHLSSCRAGHSVPAAVPGELSPCSLSASSSLSFSPVP